MQSDLRAGRRCGFSLAVATALFSALAAPGEELPARLPEGNAGIAARYPGDIGIGKDPAVIVAEDFESASEGNLRDGWRPERAKFVAPEHNLFPSRYALEWVLPQQKGPIGAGASHWFRPGFDQVFARVYWWLAPDLKIVNMHGWGIQAFRAGLDASITTGHKATGDDTFCAFLDYPLTDLSPYVYHPEQKTRFGDHFASGFKMELGRWYCTEIMLKGNTPGKRDGEMALWVDGRLIKHWTGLRLRDVADLKINRVDLEFYSHDNGGGTNRVRYDNLVVATSYIGPAAAETAQVQGAVDSDKTSPAGSAVAARLAGSRIDDATLHRLQDMTELRTLDLDFTQVGDAGLLRLKGLKRLQELDLRGAPITDAGLDEIKDLRELETLDLSCDQVTDAGLEYLQGMDRLRTLELSNAQITDAGLNRLQALKQLQTLVLAKTEVTGARWDGLRELNQLRTLDLSDTRFADAGMEGLAGLRQLQNLVLVRTKITDVGLKHLAALAELRTLDLGGTALSDAGLEHLAGLKQLRTLVLAHTQVTGVGLSHLKGLDQLRSLDLGFAQVTDAGLRGLEGLSQLRELDLAGAQITDAGLEYLRGLKQLRTLGLRKTQISSAGLHELRMALPDFRVEGGP